jgi:hypothetical protein
MTDESNYAHRDYWHNQWHYYKNLKITDTKPEDH